MSRELPERPSLDHLRKQAKVLLRDMRRRDPRAKLSTAQHALAREYGFSDWRELKARVELPPPEADVPIADYAFGRYTSAARQALFFSRDEASRAGCTAIDPEHILLGLIRAGFGANLRSFDATNVSLEAARIEVAAASSESAVPHSVQIPFSGVTRRLLLAATGEAGRMGHATIGIAHLVLALCDRGSSASSLLTRWGFTSERVRAGIAELLDGESR